MNEHKIFNLRRHLPGQAPWQQPTLNETGKIIHLSRLSRTTILDAYSPERDES